MLYYTGLIDCWAIWQIKVLARMCIQCLWGTQSHTVILCTITIRFRSYRIDTISGWQFHSFIYTWMHYIKLILVHHQLVHTAELNALEKHLHVHRPLTQIRLTRPVSNRIKLWCFQGCSTYQIRTITLSHSHQHNHNAWPHHLAWCQPKSSMNE